MQYGAIEYSTVQYSTVQCNTVQYNQLAGKGHWNIEIWKILQWYQLTKYQAYRENIKHTEKILTLERRPSPSHSPSAISLDLNFAITFYETVVISISDK